MKKNDLGLLLYRIANYYYNENMSQSEIAKLENVSRSQISRLLIMAREKGYVEIHVKLPAMNTQEMEEKLCDYLGLKQVFIAETSAHENSAETENTIITEVSTYAAARIPKLLENNQNIGVGWGRTIYNTAMQLPPSVSKEDKLFVPLVGSSGTNNPYLQTSVILNRFAERFSSLAFYPNSPCVRYVNTTPTPFEDDSIKQLQAYWESLDAAVIGLGMLPGKDTFYIAEIDPSTITADIYQNASGEILGRLFTEHGQIDWQDVTANQISFVGIPLEKLKKIRNVICIASGYQKILPIIHSAKGRYYNTLITDNLTAKSIIDFIEEQTDGSD